MKTEQLIEIARECGGRYAYTNWGYHPFTLTELQQFAQRIEAPHKQRIEALELALQKQAKSALMGIDAAKANGAAMLKVATEIHNQQKPELLDSERQVNSVLTEENEKLQQQIEQLREALHGLVSAVIVAQFENFEKGVDDFKLSKARKVLE